MNFSYSTSKFSTILSCRYFHQLFTHKLLLSYINISSCDKNFKACVLPLKYPVTCQWPRSCFPSDPWEIAICSDASKVVRILGVCFAQFSLKILFNRKICILRNQNFLTTVLYTQYSRTSVCLTLPTWVLPYPRNHNFHHLFALYFNEIILSFLQTNKYQTAEIFNKLKFWNIFYVCFRAMRLYLLSWLQNLGSVNNERVK